MHQRISFVLVLLWCGFSVFVSHAHAVAPGELLWEQPASDSIPFLSPDVGVDKEGNVYVLGFEAAGENHNYVTSKFAPDGQLLWRDSRNRLARSFEWSPKLSVNAYGAVAVAGSKVIDHLFSSIDADYWTLRYGEYSPDFIKTYNGPASYDDMAIDVAVDRFGNAYVTGTSWSHSTYSDFVTIKYGPRGGVQWKQRYSWYGKTMESADALTIDKAGNVYVVGTVIDDIDDDLDILTLKYGPVGGFKWAKRYDGPAKKSDVPSDVAVDSNGNVYVSGRRLGNGNGENYLALKYGPGGGFRWARMYDGPAHRNDRAQGIVINSHDMVYLTGRSEGDYLTLKYSPDGKKKWTRRFNGGAHHRDSANDIAIDHQGNVLVTGESGTSDDSDYATLKYTGYGKLIWVRRFDALSDDRATGLAIDRTNNVLVVGQPAIVKYAP